LGKACEQQNKISHAYQSKNAHKQPKPPILKNQQQKVKTKSRKALFALYPNQFLKEGKIKNKKR